MRYFSLTKQIYSSSLSFIDAQKGRNVFLQSGIAIEDWIDYHQVVSEEFDFRNLNYIDSRGNHDVFKVASYQSENNYFYDYSVSGQLLANQSSIVVAQSNGARKTLKRIDEMRGTELEQRFFEFSYTRRRGRDYVFVFVDCAAMPGLG
jgi:hypothetical protein